ncbi:MAG: hypothetical protein J6Y63_06290 [Bacteroidales bacterium]|nr:hypothetical protein [Bacteroidales bacterium]
MKRFRLPLLLLAAASLGACVHEFPESPNGDPMRDFSLQLQFSDDLPVRLAPATKADGAAPRYTVQLYRYRSENEWEAEPAYTYSFTRRTFNNLDTTLYLPIRVDRYRVFGWVDWSGETDYFDLSNPARISLASGYPAGEHARDAFAFTTDYDVRGKIVAGDGYNVTIRVARPVGQLRFTVPDGAAYLTKQGVDASSLTATLRYTSSIPDTYELTSGRVGGARSGVTLTATPHLESTGELVLLSDFLFSSDNGSSVSVELSVKTVSGKELITYSGEVPMRCTRATTIALERDSQPTDKILEYSAPGYYSSKQMRSYVAGRDQCASLYRDGQLTFALLKPNSDEQLVVSEVPEDIWLGDHVSVSVDWKRGTKNILSENLNLTVVQVVGNTLWLAEENTSKGLIIRR